MQFLRSVDAKQKPSLGRHLISITDERTPSVASFVARNSVVQRELLLYVSWAALFVMEQGPGVLYTLEGGSQSVSQPAACSDQVMRFRFELCIICSESGAYHFHLS